MPIFASLGAGSSRATGGIGIAASTVPGTPTIGTATATSSTTATVTFTAPANNGGSTITQYIATSSPGGITGTLNQAGSGTISISGLSAGTSYTFTVKAVNAIGQSLSSSASNSITPQLEAPSSVEYLVLAGGGSAGMGYAGGGGGGGLLTSTLSVSASTAYTVTVAAGAPQQGTGLGSGPSTKTASDSTFASITTYGGGNGNNDWNNDGGASGGSGGGGNRNGSTPGRGVYPGSSYISATRQGYDGGVGTGDNYSGGGGGAGSNGAAGSGGIGINSSITGTSVGYGGGGAGWYRYGPVSGGSYGGGGSYTASPGGESGVQNLGGGGGGTDNNNYPGKGGSGVVIIAYPDSSRALTSISGGLSYDQPTRSGYRVYRFTGGTGTISW